MKKKDIRTLLQVFRRPTSGSLKWKSVISLIEGLDGEVENRKKGSAYMVKLNSRLWSVHKPHPGNDLDKGAVKGLREFLINAGHTPEKYEEVKNETDEI